MYMFMFLCILLLQERNHGDVERYNDIIRYETLRVAVCEALESNKCPSDLL